MALPIGQLLELVCLLFALRWLLSGHPDEWRWLVAYIAVVALLDCTGWIMMKNNLRNHWVYNIATLVDIAFLGFFFRKTIPPRKAVPYLVLSGLAVSMACYLFEWGDKGFTTYFAVTRVVLTIWVTGLSLAYYYLLIKADEYIELRYHPPFWFVTGIFLYYLGSIATNLLFDYFPMLQTRNLHANIFIILNTILYGCWTYAFICKYRNKISY